MSALYSSEPSRVETSLAAALWAAVVAAVVLGVAFGVAGLGDAAPLKLYPCPTEDSDNCYRLADVDGNGHGQSFVVIDGEYTYLMKDEAGR